MDRLSKKWQFTFPLTGLSMKAPNISPAVVHCVTAYEFDVIICCVALSHQSSGDLHGSLDPLPSAHLREWHPKMLMGLTYNESSRLCVGHQLTPPPLKIHDLACDPLALIT